MPPKKVTQPEAVPTRKSSRINKEGEETPEDQSTSNDKINTTTDTTDIKSETVLESIEHSDTESAQEDIVPKPIAAPKDEMAGPAASKVDMDAVLKRLAELEKANNLGENRGARGVTPFASAFGGTEFKPTGFAALPHFKPYGKDQNAVNPDYDKKAKRSGIDPGVFTGNKAEFDKWVIKVHDKFDDDCETFRKERSRMAVINSLTQGLANDLIEARYQSTEIPFSSAAEMIATLSAVYHDDNQGTKAREELRDLQYDIRECTMDIHQFIGKVNSLADKANIAKKDRKTTLYEHIPANLNPQLLGDSKDPLISYENFANRVADSALAQARAFKERVKIREKRGKEAPRAEVIKPFKRENKTLKVEVPVTDKMKKDGACFLCGKEGHIARSCPDKTAKINALLTECQSDDESDDESTQSSDSEN
jgi:hypothetical protein